MLISKTVIEKRQKARKRIIQIKLTDCQSNINIIMRILISHKIFSPIIRLIQMK